MAEADKGEIVTAKRERGSLADELSKVLKNLRKDDLIPENIEAITTELQKLCDTFSSFQASHLQCLDIMIDPDAIATLEIHYGSVVKSFRECKERTDNWISSCRNEKDKQSRPDEDDNQSVTSNLSTSSTKLREARAKRLIAEKRKQMLKEKQALEMQRITATMQMEELEQQNAIEEAAIEESVWEEAVSEESPKLGVSGVELEPSLPMHSNRDGVANIPKTCPETASAPIATHNHAHDRTENAFLRLANALQEGFNLPKPEILTFYGNATDYTKFIRNFETTVETRVSDDSVKLSYLIQYCHGEAKRSIEDCVLMEASEGYKRAREILRSRYGRPHTIARTYVDKLTQGAPIKSNDVKGLSDLVLEMQKCEINLSQMGFVSDIDNSENLRRIVRRLPHYLRVKWVDVAQSIVESGREPKFADLVKFVDNKTRSASSVYGLDLVRDDRSKPPRPTSTKPKITTLSTQSDASQAHKRKCGCCGGNCADLTECSAFTTLPLEERIATVKRLKLCNNCFKWKHFALKCRKPAACNVPGCNKKHHPLLHSWSNSRPSETVQPSVSVATADCNQRTVTFLGIIPVEVGGENGCRVKTYALLDNGSQQSFCDEKLLHMLGVTGKPVTYSVTTLTSQEQQNRGVETDLTVKALNGGRPMTINGVWSVKKLAISSNSAAKQSDIRQYAHLADLEIPQIDTSDVLLLIGGNSEAQIPLELRSSGVKGEPYAERTALGWVVRGPSNKPQTESASVNFQQTGTLEQNLERLWKTDFSETVDNNEIGWSVEDKRAAQIMSDTITMDNGHYKLALPWSDQNRDIPNNISAAHARLNQLKRRLERDSELHEKYTEQINEYIERGHAEEVPSSPERPERVWYLPHQPVTNVNKPGKVRVVFDGAAKFRDVSLNGLLLQGPDYFNSLVGVLMRFRQEHIAVAADIEGMFNQVKVAESDRDALRFLWLPNGDLNSKPKEYRMTVHIFGAKSSPSCTTYALRKTATDNAQHYSEEAVSSVSRSFYVDDFLKSLANERAAVKLSGEMQSLLSRGGFRLTKFLSNRQSVIDSIPQSERAACVKEKHLCDEQPSERALGVRWDVHNDKITFDAKIPDKPTTRRGILAAVSSLFDPLGLAAPVTLKAKTILQELCRQKLNWDEEISVRERVSWRNWVQALPNLRNVSIPRCYKPRGFGEICDTQLHIFCDAAESGYGACAYLRFTNNKNEVSVSLVTGKSRLAPIKQVTIPRLELSAAVLASRLYKQLKDELEIHVTQAVFWTDSMITLSYIRNESRRFKVFVANRLSVIHDNTDVNQWRHVPTHCNPADLASRGIDADDAESLKVWLEGPAFLRQGEEQWPTTTNVPQVHENDTEAKKTVQVSAVSIDNDPLHKLFLRYSDWHKLQRAVSWLLRFKGYCISKYLKGKSEVCRTELTVDELSKATNSVFSYVQRQCFGDELDKVMKGQPVQRSSRLANLSPVYREGLLRVGGLLQFSELEDENKSPVILPDKHAVTSLVISSLHTKNGHVGVNQVLAESRKKYWILRGRSAIKRVIGLCYECKRRNQRPCQQKMAPLQQERMTPDKPPFTYVGVDYFGPLMVKVGRSHSKRYGVIFTCLATRAIHLEVSHTLDTDSFLAAFQRFVSRRGHPSKVFSDRGTNLTSGERELREALSAWNQGRINDRLLQQEISWKFNPPQASHAGGVWERMIRSVRRIMKSLVGEQLLNDEALMTLFAEVEKILNDRPITQISDDASDPEPLSPNKLLLLRSNSCLPYGTFDKNDVYAQRWWRQVQYLANVFWRRWIREYLPALQVREKWQRPHRNMRVNDVVLIGEENLPRGQWPIGRVVSVNIGRDGYVRSCTVKTGKTELVRPIVKLYLLEGSH